MTTIEIKGMDELQKILRELPYQVRGTLIYNAIRRAAKPMKDEAVNLAPRSNRKRVGNDGPIHKAITIVRDKATEAEPTAIIAVTKGKKALYDAWYAHFQERGTSGFGKRKKSQTWDKGLARTAIFSGKSVAQLRSGRRSGIYQITESYKHKGSGLPAVRFMSTAYGDNVEEVLNNIHKELSVIVGKYLRKNAPEYYVN